MTPPPPREKLTICCHVTSRGVALYSTDTQYRVLAKDSQREVDLVLTRNLGGAR